MSGVKRDPATTERAGLPTPSSPAYAIAVGAVGMALVAFLIGAAVIAAGGKPVPTQYWSSGSAIAGALLGILAPTPATPNADAARRQASAPGGAPGQPDKAPSAREILAGIVVALRDLWSNRALFILLFVFVVTLLLSIVNNSAQLQALAAAAGGALIGLLAPPPAGSTHG